MRMHDVVPGEWLMVLGNILTPLVILCMLLRRKR